MVATPDHYGFAYRYLFGDDAALKSEVDAIIDGCVRISPRQIETLAANAPQLDHIAAALLDIIGTASQGAGRFGTELTLAARALITADARNLKTREDHHPIGDITLSAGLVAARGDDALTLMASAQALALSAQRAGGNVTHHRPS